MKRILPLVFLLLPAFFLTSLSPLNAQQEEPEELLRCATDQWLEIQMQDPDFAENFRKMENRIRAKSVGRNPVCSNPVILPVAIHWNGNINDVPCLLDMAENQIEVLNRDFGGYNDDLPEYCEHAYNCPDEYPLDAVTGGTCVQFCLATQNHPPGSGLQNGEPAFTFGQYTFNTGAPAWSGYVNIFVSNVPPSGYGSGLLGLAPLYGGANPNGNGVFVHARAFGGFEEECDAGYVINNANSYDEGRTTTHELGHYYGLYHTFQGCGYGDGIADTPSQNEPNYGSPSVNYTTCTSTALNTCGTQDFFFNYMDYTNDGGMYMFTSDQSDRIYNTATSGNYKSDALVCGSTSIAYNPTYPTGCYVCPTLSINATLEHAECFADCNGSISVDDVVDGVGPFTYSWSNGETGSTIDNLCAGEYSVTIYDSYNCEVIESFTIEEPGLLQANSSSTDESGNDFENGTATANPSGGTPPYYYNWSNGETTQTITDLPPNIYTVTVTDFNGCQSVESQEIIEFFCPYIDIETTTEDILCHDVCNGVINITNVINGVEPIAYQWNTGQQTGLITDLCAGGYVVTLTDNLNCSFESDTLYVNEPEPLLAITSAIGETGPGANDGTATVDALGGTPVYDFEWSNGETTQTITGLSPDVYWVTVTDNNGCEKEDYVIVDAFECPEFTLESNTQNPTCFDSCDGLIEILDLVNGTAPLTYQWSDGQSEFFATGLCAGSHSVTITDDTGCSTTQSFELTAPDALNVLLETTGETAFGAQDGSASVTVSGGTEPYNILWSTGETASTLTQLPPGSYSVTTTDGNGCEEILPFEINAFICHELDVTAQQLDPVCFGDCTGQISVTGLINGTAPLSYEWSDGSSEANRTGLCAGTYTVTVTDTKNCAETASFSLSQPDPMSVTVNTTAETANEENDGTASALVQGGTPPYELAWSNGETSDFIGDLAPGDYRLTVTDAAGCTNEVLASIDAFICPDLAIQSNVIHNPCFGDCEGTIGIISVNNGTEPYTYTWNTGQSGPTLENLCAGTYLITITDDKNCPVEQAFTIEEPAEIVITIDNVTNVTGEGPGAIGVTTNGNYEYSWTGDNGYLSVEEDIDNLGKGCYTLVVTDPETGCTADTTVCVDDLTTVLDAHGYDQVSLFPNPADHTLIIGFGDMAEKEISIHFIDWRGMIAQSLVKNDISDKLVVNTAGLPAGIYVVRLNFGEKVIHRKVVILH